MNQKNFQLEEAAPLRYLLALSGGSTSEESPRPVLCFLHGYDEGAPLNIEVALTRHGPLRDGNAVDATGNFIVIAPQMPVRGDLWHRYADAVQQIAREVQERHHGDLHRTYLTGFSFGGNGVFDLELVQPRLWAALWAVDPTRIPSRDPGCPVWLSFGAVARYNKEGFISALDLKPISAGSEPDRVYLDEGADHVGSATRAYQDERIYSWLLSKRLS